MRPVKKWETGSLHGESVVVKEEYKPSRTAQPVLVANLGMYCSYCEKSMHEEPDLEVEHIEPSSKASITELVTQWDNFLLACPTCNKHKGNKTVILNDIHLPHRNNTYKSIVYNEAGGILPNKNMSSLSIQHADNLIKLLSLDNRSKTDMRRRTWQLAVDALKDYEGGKTTLDLLLQFIEQRGGWSIWFTVFKGHDEVRRRLIEYFPGTEANCFDSNNHYEPVDRNPGKEDPV